MVPARKAPELGSVAHGRGGASRGGVRRVAEGQGEDGPGSVGV